MDYLFSDNTAMYKDTADILKALMKADGIGENGLARKTGVPQPTIHRILHRESQQPRKSTLLPIANYFKIPVETLIRGIDVSDGKIPRSFEELAQEVMLEVAEERSDYTDISLHSMLVNKADRVRSLQNRTDERSHTTGISNSADFVLVPLVEAFYHGGNGHGMKHHEEPKFLKSLSFRRDWLEYENLTPGKLKVAMVHGKSMEPTLKEDDVILVDLSEDCYQAAESGHIYAMVYKGAPLVKRLFKQDMGGCKLVSDNKPGYDDISISAEDTDLLQVIGRVVWAGGKVR